MGVVYKARQKSLDRWVAIKILSPARASQPGFAERFVREARTLARLNHPNIVAVFDHGESGGLYYFVMEFVDGVNLRDLLRDGKLEPEQALAIVPPICEALQCAHDQGVVHRDIKPENLLLDRSGRVKIADFGIAALVGAEGEPSGTPAYMAPEQADRRTEVDHRADIYALGVVLYEMLTGERPQGMQVVEPSKKAPIDVRLDEIVLRALEKKPALRYQQASVFQTQVETVANSPTPGVPSAPDQGALPPGEKAPVPAGPSRRMGSSLVFALVGVLLGSLVLGLLWYRHVALQADAKAHPLRAVVAANTRVISPPPSNEAKRLRALAALERAAQEARRISNSDEFNDLMPIIARDQALAGDPQAGVRTAESIDDQFHRDFALRGVAKTQAEAGDLPGARATVARIHEPQDNNLSKDFTLVDVAGGLAWAGHLDEALEVANAQEGKELADKPYALLAIVGSLAKKGDLPAALRVLNELAPSQDKNLALRSIAEAQARAHDLPAALQAVAAIESESEKNQAFGDIAEEQANAGQVDAALRTITNITEESIRRTYLWNIEATSEHTGNTATVEKVLASLQPLDADGQAKADLARISVLIEAGQFSTAAERIEHIPDPALHEGMWYELAGTQARRGDPLAAARTLEKVSQPSPPMFIFGISDPVSDIAYAQYVAGRGGVDQIIETLAVGASRTNGFVSFASSLLVDLGRTGQP